jgi:hypothetical protein
MFFRFLVRNDGWRTLKDCHAELVRVTKRVGGNLEDFKSERHTLGWAHYPQSAKRDIGSRGGSYHLDVATLLLRQGGSNELWWEKLPKTLHKFIFSVPGKARYTFYVRIEADNAPPKLVRAEFLFDPTKDELTFIPLNTRWWPWPLWQMWWRLRALRSRRGDSSAAAAATCSC